MLHVEREGVDLIPRRIRRAVTVDIQHARVRQLEFNDDEVVQMAMVGRVRPHAPLDIDAESCRHAARVLHLIAIRIRPHSTR